MTLSEMPNLGKVNEERLKEVGIETPEELRAIGTEGAFVQVREVDKGACLHLLYGLEGAIKGIPKKDICPARKEALKDFYHRL
ncbi:TfoX/Sxy family protein [uncultured Vagococcus sp.]|uniref:TfoX/Sxy family protein n=1 Tax=uncultured Vagococcus sp. TaxID=189676 RepID=UPI0028D86490|nr:TfoX/Sxy family protein [uncultured Vagococcus sp.]